jgi:hypothetical protein
VFESSPADSSWCRFAVQNARRRNITCSKKKKFINSDITHARTFTNTAHIHICTWACTQIQMMHLYIHTHTRICDERMPLEQVAHRTFVRNYPAIVRGPHTGRLAVSCSTLNPSGLSEGLRSRACKYLPLVSH